MKPILKFLARLYPSVWRNRYGAEYDALLDDATPRARDVANVVWEATKARAMSSAFLRIVAPCGLLGLATALATSFGPRQFTSTAVLWVSSQPAIGACGPQQDLPPGLQGASRQACEDPQTSLEQIARTWVDSALDAQFLALTIEKLNLYPKERRTTPVDQLAQRMLGDIRLVPRRSKDYISQQFELQFSYPDPGLARRVDAALVAHAFDLTRLGKLPHFSLPRESRIGLAVRPSVPEHPDGLSGIARSVIGLMVGLLCGAFAEKTLRTLGHAV